MVRITGIEESSPLLSLGVRAGDTLVAVNKNEIRDVLDYRFYITDRNITLSLVREDGEEYEVFLRKREYDDVGLEFETPLMDKKHTCKNKCIFCFVDQMPKGLRETLYFKDDDSRLSFLHGNYITLTNMTDEDIDRIIKMHISPINISVHTTNPELRVKMMKNKRSGEVLSYLGRLADAGISLCTQLVLCPGINDGEELMRSMHDLVALCPSLISCAAVPVGITKFRDGLYPLRTYTKEEARAVIETVNSFGDYCKKKYGSRIFTVADEFYLKAEMDIPSEEYYEDYPQLENGVGLIRSVKEDLRYYLADSEPFELKKDRRVLAVTGVAAYPTVCELSEMIKEKADRLCVDVLCVKNDFFGETVTVAGLLTATDIEKAVKEHIKNTGASYDALIIPDAALKADEDVFLDGVSLTSLSDRLGIHAVAAKNEPCDMVSAFLFG
ncbi:MAG: DUF512 domain-containing protein [Ruminococcaceae bacterium]|nr:DUF512 domain-containing protein [Oscillospiraceae bacterium]